MVIGPYKRRIKLKKWIIERFLPMWAKETVLKENRRLRLELCRVQEENARLQAYIKGLHAGIRAAKRTKNGQLTIEN